MPSERFVAFREACWSDLAIASRMLEDDPSLIDVRSGLGETVLHYCAIENDEDVVRFLLSAGADPNPVNQFGASPLQECAMICTEEWNLSAVMKILLDAGADPYHLNGTVGCAWHQAQLKRLPWLWELFRMFPDPGEHETCELMAFLGAQDMPSEE